MAVSQKQGFSLIELLLVIAIISILAITVTIRFPSSTISVSAQALQLASDIRYTQSLSMSRGMRFYLIRVSSTSYQIRDSTGIALPLVTGTTVNLVSGVSFGTFTNLPNNLIAFSGDGTPYITTTIPGTPLAALATIPLTATGNTKTVTITPETGRVIVQ